ncbi:SDR family oxidoreductase [Bosea sp. (in: a-proteobacteria)]|uniref:SDR family oxidoreductase n=1 Tax=Bosea sp. (in: a-proteobacteria) TaxID=1871050 RepID=UPI0026365595|nr:SDR family oxidoreductase [Bosea sp. (in: a-proteobacteria)]MCO5090359.1 SDR family oxidoreductase [Bosea sp. (in: a-proteobacteria)]
MSRFIGKVAFVTGAGQGIGRATALRLASEGADVMAVDLNPAGLETLAGPRISVSAFDAGDPARLTGAIGALPRLDILVNCVGWVPVGSILDGEAEDWQRAFRINVDTVFTATRAALPAMLAAGRGSIVNIASVAGLRCVAQRAAYSATKAAVIGLTRSVSADFAPRGIRCNAICPAMIESPSLEERIAAMPDPGAARALFMSRHPVGRLGTADEVAAAVAYLAADESGFTTGTTLSLDGGTG